MKIAMSGTLNRIDPILLNLSTNLTPTEIPASWFTEDEMGYLQVIYIFDNGRVRWQFGRTKGLPENPVIDRLNLKAEIISSLCIELGSGLDKIVCHEPQNFKDNALLGLWSSRREEGDPIEVLLIDQA